MMGGRRCEVYGSRRHISGRVAKNRDRRTLVMSWREAGSCTVESNFRLVFKRPIEDERLPVLPARQRYLLEIDATDGTMFLSVAFFHRGSRDPLSAHGRAIRAVTHAVLSAVFYTS